MDFEESIGLHRIVHQPRSGVTEEGKLFFSEHRRLIGQVARIVLRYVKDPGWDFLTYRVDCHDDAIILDSLSWGYRGEGVTGLLWLFEQLGWGVDSSDLPPAHTVGVWVVSPDGSVVSLE